MKRSYFSITLATFLFINSLAFVLTTAPALAQNSGAQTTTQSGGAQTTTHTTETTSWINPTWLIIGGVALILIILLIVVASRGRSGGDTHVRESTTVVKKE